MAKWVRNVRVARVSPFTFHFIILSFFFLFCYFSSLRTSLLHYHGNLSLNPMIVCYNHVYLSDLFVRLFHFMLYSCSSLFLFSRFSWFDGWFFFLHLLITSIFFYFLFLFGVCSCFWLTNAILYVWDSWVCLDTLAAMQLFHFYFRFSKIILNSIWTRRNWAAACVAVGACVDSSMISNCICAIGYEYGWLCITKHVEIFNHIRLHLEKCGATCLFVIVPIAHFNMKCKKLECVKRILILW